MEEEIKILEDLKNKWELNDFGDMVNVLSLNEVQAIENLIKGYREIEEENKKLVEANDNLKATKRIKTYKEIEKHFIPKSKIKEKIDELDKKIRKIENKKVWNEPADTIIRNRFCNYYNALQELMEDK